VESYFGAKWKTVRKPLMKKGLAATELRGGFEERQEGVGGKLPRFSPEFESFEKGIFELGRRVLWE